MLVEGAALEDGLAKGGEVVWADPAIVRESGFVWDDQWGDAVDPAFAFEDHGADERDGLDAGEGAKFCEDAVVEADSDLVVCEGRALEEDVGSDDVFGGEAFVEGGEIGEALGEEPGDEKKRRAGKDLGPDEGSDEVRCCDESRRNLWCLEGRRAGLMRRRRRAGRMPQMKVAPTVRRIERAKNGELTEMV